MPPARRTAQSQAPAVTPAAAQPQWQMQPQQAPQPRPRPRVPSRPTSRNETNSTATATNAAAAAAPPSSQQPGPAPVRRNLFSSTLSRRPQAAANSSAEQPAEPSASSISNRASSMPAIAGASNISSGSGFTPGPPGTLPRGTSSGQVDGTKFGRGGFGRKDDVEAEDSAILAPEPVDAAGKKAALEQELLLRNLEEANLAAAASASGGGGVGGLPDEATEMDEKEHSARLIELYRSHARQRIDPNELKAAVQESLRRKVASLDDDKWMYEAESDSEES